VKLASLTHLCIASTDSAMPALRGSALSALAGSTVGDVLAVRTHTQPLSRWTCTPNDTLRRLVDKMVGAEKKCTFVVDSNGVCIAVISVSDICQRLLDNADAPCSPTLASPRTVDTSVPKRRERGNRCARRARIQYVCVHSESYTFSRDVYMRAVASPQWYPSTHDALSVSDATPLRQCNQRRVLLGLSPQQQLQTTATQPLRQSPIRVRNPTKLGPPAQLPSKDHTSLS
jgi:hypothetical protein